MRKRAREKTDDEIRNKISRLEKELKSRRKTPEDFRNKVKVSKLTKSIEKSSQQIKRSQLSATRKTMGTGVQEATQATASGTAPPADHAGRERRVQPARRLGSSLHSSPPPAGITASGTAPPPTVRAGSGACSLRAGSDLPYTAVRRPQATASGTALPADRGGKEQRVQPAHRLRSSLHSCLPPAGNRQRHGASRRPSGQGAARAACVRARFYPSPKQRAARRQPQATWRPPLTNWLQNYHSRR
ncbi:unnamed protein product [Parnassius apollo]|uniref:(apollo) hypothetical protein n=1 Tax=Parnassius apollo TaxID=110799 RepID=A0A8S3W598_PARAO|nr:unnamed protein product [Parnassius apollo]